MKDMLYGELEPVWLLKPKKKDDNKKGNDGGSSSTKGSPVKAPQKQNGKEKKAPQKEEYSILNASPFYPYYYPDYVEEYFILNVIPFYPYYYPDYVAPYPDYVAPYPHYDAPSEDNKEESKVVMKVPICGLEWEDNVKVALGEIKGVKSVDYNFRSEKVTVTATTAAAADILLQFRRVFKSSRMWSDED